MRRHARLQAPRLPYAFQLSTVVRPLIAPVDCAVTRILDYAAPLGQKAGRGHWNDLDMLEVGNGGMTFDEYGRCTLYLQLVYDANAA